MPPSFNTSQGKDHFREIHDNYLAKFDDTLEHNVSIFILLPVLIPLFPVCVSVMLFFFLLRNFVIMFATFLHKDTPLKPMETPSAFYACSDDVFGSPVNTPIVGMVLQGSLDVEQVRKTMREKCLLKRDENGEPTYPELMQSVTYFCGYPFYKPIPCECHDEVLEKLVRVCEPTDGRTWERDSVQRFLTKLTFRPFSKELPLWELLILPNYQPNPDLDVLFDPSYQHCFLVLRWHHSLADAISMFTLWECCSIVTPEAPFSAKWVEQRLMPSLGFAAFQWITQGVCELPLFLLKEQYVGCKASLWRNERSGGNVPECDRFVTSWPRYVDMKEIRDIRLHHEVSGTSVIICTYLRCVRRLLLLRGHKTLPSEVQFWITSPVPRLNNHLQNASMALAISVPFDVDNANQHLQDVDIAFKRYQKSLLTIIFYLGLKLGGYFPRGILRLAASGTSNGRDIIALSSIPGPATFKDVFGQPIKSLSVQTGIIRDYRGPVAFLCSQGGQTFLTTIAGSRVMPNNADIQEVVNGFLIELKCMEQSGDNDYPSIEATARLLRDV